MTNISVTHPAVVIVKEVESLWIDAQLADKRSRVIVRRLISNGYLRGTVTNGWAPCAPDPGPDLRTDFNGIVRDLVDTWTLSRDLGVALSEHLKKQPQDMIMREFPQQREWIDANQHLEDLMVHLRGLVAGPT